MLNIVHFWATLWGLRARYDVHVRFIGKHIVNFLLIQSIELVLLGVMAEALRAKIDRKSAAGSVSATFSHKRRRSPPITFATNALQLCRWQFSHKKLCSRLSSSNVRFYAEKGCFAFLSRQFGSLGVTYNDHLRLIGKHVVDFLLVLTEPFSLGVTTEELQANIGSKSVISLQRGRLTQNFR